MWSLFGGFTLYIYKYIASSTSKTVPPILPQAKIPVLKPTMYLFIIIEISGLINSSATMVTVHWPSDCIVVHSHMYQIYCYKQSSLVLFVCYRICPFFLGTLYTSFMVCNNPRLRLMKALTLHHMINVCRALVFLYESPPLGILTKVEASIVQLVRLEPA